MNNPAIDTALSYKLLKMLLTPFKETDAFKYGIIDGTGKVVRRPSNTFAERSAFTPLHKLIFNIKRLINKTPGGDSRMKNLAAGLFLAKENYESEYDQNALVESFLNLVNEDKILIEEEVQIIMFEEAGAMGGVNTSSDGPSLTGTGGAPINNTSGASVNEPKIYPKRKKPKVLRRKKWKP